MVATGGSSAATTGASCGSFRGGGGAGGVGGGIAAAAVAGDGIVAEGEVAVAAAVRTGSPNGGRRRSARMTGTKVSEGGTAMRPTGYRSCSVEGTGTGRSCAAGSVPGFWGRCWFSSPDYPSEPAPAAESPQGYFQFSNDLVSSH